MGAFTFPVLRLLRACCHRVGFRAHDIRMSASGHKLTDAMPRSDLARHMAPPWMISLKKALNHGGTQRVKRTRDCRRKHVQLATVDPATGRPCVRTIVFRGFLSAALADGGVPRGGDDESCLLTFVTDSRAAKVSHVRGGSAVELCWWLDEASVQFRISGRAVLAAQDSEALNLRAIADAVWDRLSESTRATFSWPQPGADLGQGGTEPDGPHFAVLVLVPEQVEELRLGGNQKRLLYTHEGLGGQLQPGSLQLPANTEWTMRELNP